MGSKMRQKRLESKLNKVKNGVPTPRKAKKKVEDVAYELKSKGVVDAEQAEKVARGRSSSVKRTLLKKRKRDATAGGDEDGGSVGRAASAARGRSASRMKGFANEQAANSAEKTRRKRMKLHEKLGKKGESDRHIPDLKPKHLYSGKRGIGKTDRR